MKTYIAVFVGVLAITFTFLFPWVIYDAELVEVKRQARRGEITDFADSIGITARTRYLQGELGLAELDELESKTGRDYGRSLLRADVRASIRPIWADSYIRIHWGYVGSQVAVIAFIVAGVILAGPRRYKGPVPAAHVDYDPEEEEAERTAMKTRARTRRVRGRSKTVYVIDKSA
jgi:hypothetical protein